MQLTVTPENPLEWLALQANLVPIPMLHAQIMPVVAKAVLEAADKGVFDAVAQGNETVETIAQTCQLNAKALNELLGLLTSLGYFTYREGRFALTKMANRWVRSDDPDSVHGFMLFNNRLMWQWLDKMGHYLETGEGLQYHDTMTPDEWSVYQNGMLAAAVTEAREFGQRAPVPNAIRASASARMLDIGGAHGQHSVALCKRLPNLSATILDLPQAIDKAAPLLAKMGLGDRVRHQAGNVLADDLGENQYDIILMSSLAHHFSSAQNQQIADKVARSLKPGGIYIVNEFIRPKVGAKPELVGASTDLFYGLTSTAGNYSVAEINAWQQAAGLKPLKTVSYRSLPGRMQVVAIK